MSEVETWRIRHKDEHGELLAAGFSWLKPNIPLIKRRVWVNLLSWFFLVAPPLAFLLVGGFKNPPPNAGLWFGGLAALCLTGVLWARRNRGLRLYYKRGLVFLTDGRTFVFKPMRGDETTPEYKPSKILHENIVSIEGRPTPSVSGGHARIDGTGSALYQVDLHYEDGTSQPAADLLTDPDAMRLITVQLNQALREVREAMMPRIG